MLTFRSFVTRLSLSLSLSSFVVGCARKFETIRNGSLTLSLKIETFERRDVSKGIAGELGVAISARLMELTYSTCDEAIGIDLNEVPSSSSSEALSPDAFAVVVRTFHGNPPAAAGGPATVPEDSSGAGCAACGQPEVRGHTVVCDGCERGFHISCTGMRGRQAVALDDWMCGECVSDGVRNSRWPLGLKSKLSGKKRNRAQFLDINSSPPSDGEGQWSEDFSDSRYECAFISFGSCNSDMHMNVEFIMIDYEDYVRRKLYS
ncbi:hypothetical protein Acr_05g0008180 [Actinidia rufa]|uniref:PHD-type domain-containing protein n=1 Tax=Actinidia rufa TaxID=165716 RepID=A0A7J0EMG5_9ERIC|nr:hypothetical protein Acr_05g0008180 [Actinidia rufa]